MYCRPKTCTKESADVSATTHLSQTFLRAVRSLCDAGDPDEHGVPWDDPRIKHLWSVEQPILSARDAVVAEEAE